MKSRENFLIVSLMGVFVLGVCVFGGFRFLAIFNGKKKLVKPRVSRTVKTLYGTFTVKDPLIVELLDCAAMQRIKGVHQFGTMYFIKEDEDLFTRYEHSVGVWALLRRFGASREEQVAGLLHDVSHTVFSHVGDHVFSDGDSKDSYQDNIHEWYIKQTDVPAILKKYNMTLGTIDHKLDKYTMLEQELPDICADRLEYTLKEGHLKNLVSKDDVDFILENITFEKGKWCFLSVEAARKFAYLSLYLAQNVWGAKKECIVYPLSARAIKQAFKVGLLTKREMHFSTDGSVWQKLILSDDPIIRESVDLLRNYKDLQVPGTQDQHDHLVSTKFRAINPMVKTRRGQHKRLSELDTEFYEKYLVAKNSMKQGWPVRFVGKLGENKQLVENLFA